MNVDHGYLDSKRSPLARTQILLAQMTLEEKVGQLMQITCMKADPKFEDGKATGWIYSRMDDETRRKWVLEKNAGSFLHVLGEEIEAIQALTAQTRLKIPVLFGIDAIHGHALHNGATVFPSQLAMSCSWDEGLVEKAGRVTAKEVAADGIHWTFSPVLCIARDTRWGRVGETFGEDPYLIGELGAALIKGYQTDDLAGPDSILACAKHYLAYGESTGGRDSYDTQITMRKAREVFLPPFARAVEAGCATFMTGYQSIDGTPITASKAFIRQVLKDELGFEGFVVTDWNNAESLVTQQRVAKDLLQATQMTIEAGNDMYMNTPGSYEALIDLVASGAVSQATLDQAVSRVLLTKFKLGLFEKTSEGHPHAQTDLINCAEHRQVNLALTRKTLVLLENKQQTLPLSKAIKRLAVIGPNADDIQAQYGDWTFFSHPIPKDETPLGKPISVLQGIQELGQSRGVTVVHHRGCHIMDPQDQAIPEAVALANSADAIVAVVGDCLAQNGEFKDRGNLDLSGAQNELLRALKATGKPLIVVLVSGKPLTIPQVSNWADALLCAFNPGQMGGQAIAEVLFGEVCPSGKLSISFPAHVGQLPVYYNQLPGWHGSKYMDLPMAPLYPFGYGLSYTQFTYSNLRLSAPQLGPEAVLNLDLDVTNSGGIDSEEVVQLYVQDLVSSVMSPFKTLKAFKRVKIKAGETQTVQLHLPMKALYVVDQEGQKVLESGDFKLYVGPSSQEDRCLSATFSLL